MASKMKSGTRQKDPSGSGSGDGNLKTAQTCTSTFRTQSAALGKDTKRSESKEPPKSETSSNGSVIASSGDQTNAEVKTAKGGDPGHQTTPKWSKSSRVKDQIKFLEQKNKGSGQAGSQRRFGDRSASEKTGEVRSPVTRHVESVKSRHCWH